jgi:iron complex transport system ATP-binding protein
MEGSPLVARALEFAYERHTVLRGVDLRLEAGEVVGLIGPNGSGKSTLIKLSAGILLPKRGSIEVFGRAPAAWEPRELARVLAYVPQDGSVPPGFTVWDSALLGRTPYLGFLGMARDRDRQVATRALEWVGLTALADRRVGELSGGERQRVVLARALAQEPRCVLLDEPTTHLDIHHQVAILSLVRRLVIERGMAALVVLHDLNLASTFADQLVLLAAGRVLAQGTPRDVLRPELMRSIYGNEVATYQRPDDDQQPAVLPLRNPKPSAGARGDGALQGQLQVPGLRRDP